ncbi:hypothetical protein [Bifidobacterium cuniculi]|uniref:Thioredoxin reductase-like protein n=1 Tax=Bifidobacterium cuniculi TaxID=1688 RepID=A0A087B4P2_9BIFI|nr:hypothetical protein [Bifidobacterium cuniculi]KFI65992.1 thioredoxin reductase-like protein [Bifidobacterium cuniculi]
MDQHPTDGAAALDAARFLWPELFGEESIRKIRVECARMDRPLTLQLQLDRSSEALLLRTMAHALVTISQGRLLTIEEQVTGLGIDGHHVVDLSSNLPYATPLVRVLNVDGNGVLGPAGLAFHGVPAGRQFHPFVMGLFNAAGPGQPLSEEETKRIEAIHDPVDLMLLVSLDGDECARAAHAAQRLAAANTNVRAELYDATIYPHIAGEYGVDATPGIVANRHGARQVVRDVRNVTDLLDVLDHM